LAIYFASIPLFLKTPAHYLQGTLPSVFVEQ